MPDVGGHDVPSGMQLIEASQQVVPGPHSARAQKLVLLSVGGEIASKPDPPSPEGFVRSAVLPSDGVGAVEDPQAMSHKVDAHTAIRTNEDAPLFFMAPIVSHRTNRSKRPLWSFGRIRSTLSGPP